MTELVSKQLKSNDMTNVTIEKKAKILTITVDLSKAGTPSATGKSLVIASTNGNQPVEGAEGVFIGLNVYKKVK
jgi:hypothetical protein